LGHNFRKPDTPQWRNALTAVGYNAAG